MNEQMKQINGKITDAFNINNQLHGTLNVLATSIGDCGSELDNKKLQQCFVLLENLSHIVQEELEEARDIIVQTLYGKEQNNG